MLLHQLFINRDNIFRKFLRHITPNFIKRLFFNSGIIERINQINAKKMDYEKLTEEDRELVSDYFKEDLKKLKQEFDITF